MGRCPHCNFLDTKSEPFDEESLFEIRDTERPKRPSIQLIPEGDLSLITIFAFMGLAIMVGIVLYLLFTIVVG